MMESMFCLNSMELKEAGAALTLAKQLGLIETDTLEAVEARRKCRNEENQRRMEGQEPVYGPVSYSPAAYLQYELIGFLMDFVAGAEEIKQNYTYRTITETDKRKFYEENPDLFTRYEGDLFSYEESELIIEKRLREAEYDALIQNILCQSN